LAPTGFVPRLATNISALAERTLSSKKDRREGHQLIVFCD